MRPLLEVKDLHVSYVAQNGQPCAALGGVSFVLRPGKILGVLGESGSGKSTLAAAMMGLLPPNGRVSDGAVVFEGRNLVEASPREMQKIRGERIALIPQEPLQALHPTMRVADQVGEVIAAHRDLPRRTVREKTREILATFFATETERIAGSYPHQLSGGQRARVCIAQAVCCWPSLIIADEPTALLDPETLCEVAAILSDLQRRLQVSLIWITHNPTLLRELADDVLVLYAGKVLEMGPSASVLSSPRHPYTQALLQCLPPDLQEGRNTFGTMLPVIGGEPPSSLESSRGCAFELRCEERMDMCGERAPEAVHLDRDHEVFCFNRESGR